jgi:hypothetical protein
VICFEGGVLRVARIGPLTGIKALIRMLCWDEGTFEFHTSRRGAGRRRRAAAAPGGAARAARNIDESRRIDAARFRSRRGWSRATSEGQFTGALSKVEEALLDVAQAGFTVQRALEVIPEPIRRSSARCAR